MSDLCKWFIRSSFLLLLLVSIKPAKAQLYIGVDSQEVAYHFGMTAYDTYGMGWLAEFGMKPDTNSDTFMLKAGLTFPLYREDNLDIYLAPIAGYKRASEQDDDFDTIFEGQSYLLEGAIGIKPGNFLLSYGFGYDDVYGETYHMFRLGYELFSY